MFALYLSVLFMFVLEFIFSCFHPVHNNIRISKSSLHYVSTYSAIIKCVEILGNCCALSILHMKQNLFHKGARGSVVVKALCYKPEGREFDTR
jgi:hypothetical protein